MTVDELAKILHESGRGAIVAGNTVAAAHFGVIARVFIEWSALDPAAREGRKQQAAWLLERYAIEPVEPEAKEPEAEDEFE